MSLKELRSHLLDLGKRNRLLNYKENGYKGISVLNKDTNTLYRAIKDSREFKILNLEPILLGQRALTFDTSSSIYSYSKPKVIDILSPIVRPNELICHKVGYIQERVLNKIYKEYKFSLKERGINSLYIAFGFIEYKEKDAIYKAPLLLIPLAIKLKNGIYTIKNSDDETVLNPSLYHYLMEIMHIKLPDIADDEELDSYLKRVEKSLGKKYMVYNEVALGIFSFNKMTMYDDLLNNEKAVLNNKNIRALIYKENVALNLKASVPLYPVKDYDSTQLEAISLAANGNSFLVEGPPGSGKSQTIVNIISTLIGNGKRVLFVSEKLAALEVVYNNLRLAGLSDFALELHSNKANKKNFISELYRVATLPKYILSSKGEDYLEEMRAYSSYLEGYLKGLNDKVDGEYTLYDLIEEYEGISNTGFTYDNKLLSNLSYSKIKEYGSTLNDYYLAMKPLGYSYKELPFNIFISLKREYIDYEMQADLDDSIKYLYKLIEIRDKLNKYIKIDNKKIISINDLYRAMDFVAKINTLAIKTEVYLDKEKRKAIADNIKAYNNKKAELIKIDSYDEEVLKLDLKPMYRYIMGSKSAISRTFDKTYKQYKRTILGYRKHNASYNELCEELKLLINNKSCKEKMDYALANLKKITSSNNVASISSDLELTRPFVGYRVSFKDKDALTDVLIAYKNYYSEDLSLNKLARNIDPMQFDIFNVDLSLAYSKLKDIYLNKALISSYFNTYEAIRAIDSLGLRDFLDSYLLSGLPLASLRDSFKKEALRNKLMSIINNNPILSKLAGATLADKLNEYIKLLKRALLINRDIVIAKNSAKRPDNIIEGGAFSILAHEEAKLKRKMPIRMLMDQIMDFILALKPVFLMSPLSVSTYLNSKEGMFDTVIFDEASQIYAWDALGSIYRAKQCIIIGDSKQMPPSSFFSADSSSDEDDEYLQSESILDMASLSLPRAALRFHYRSRSEELIEFSNEKFYNSSLITIPSAKRDERLGVKLIYLENGRYDSKTRTNLVEANKICDLVIEHLSNSSESLGVVAFSEVQASLIEDLLEERIKENPKLTKLFKEDIPEPFFIKNLESVQGDERDRIILSICYGYNEENKFYQRFGPLNNQGGERRLNVAITRAKYNVTIVSSIRYMDIKPRESLGSILLRDYLKFAEDINTREYNTTSNSPIINELISFLNKNGYKAIPSLGSSQFKLSLAIKANDNTGFIAAIMLDNREAHSIRDEFYLFKLLLERQGFKYYRISPVAWFKDYQQEGKRLLDFLNSNNIVNKPTLDKESYLELDDDSIDIKESMTKYIKVDNLELLDIFKGIGPKEMIDKIIEGEAPIKISYLYKRVAEVLEKKTVTKTIKALVDSSIDDGYIIQDLAIWKEEPHMIAFRIDSSRAIEDIPTEELMDGILNIVKEASIIDRYDAYKRLSQILGFKRLGENAKKSLDKAVVFLELEGKIIVKGDRLAL